MVDGVHVTTRVKLVAAWLEVAVLVRGHGVWYVIAEERRRKPARVGVSEAERKRRRRNGD